MSTYIYVNYEGSEMTRASASTNVREVLTMTHRNAGVSRPVGNVLNSHLEHQHLIFELIPMSIHFSGGVERRCWVLRMGQE